MKSTTRTVNGSLLNFLNKCNQRLIMSFPPLSASQIPVEAFCYVKGEILDNSSVIKSLVRFVDTLKNYKKWSKSYRHKMVIYYKSVFVQREQCDCGLKLRKHSTKDNIFDSESIKNHPWSSCTCASPWLLRKHFSSCGKSNNISHIVMFSVYVCVSVCTCSSCSF